MNRTKTIIIGLVFLVLAGLWLQSTAWFRLQLAEHYKNSGQQEKAVQMYEKVLRKEGIETDNFLAFKADLDKDIKYTIVKKLADYNYKKDNNDKTKE